MLSSLDRASAIAGGSGFALFWIGGLLDLSVGEWVVSLGLHAATIALLAWAGVAMARKRTPERYRGVAVIAAGATVAGLVGSLELVMVGMLVLGLSMTAGPSAPVLRAGAVALVGGALVFLAVRAINGPFWGDGTPDPSQAAAVGFAVSLLSLGLGWVMLGLGRDDGVRSSVDPAAISAG